MNEALSKHYGRPVVAGYTNGGVPVVRPADAPDDGPVVAGGFGGEIAPAVRAVIAANASLEEAIDYLLD
jgi:hypothetical protein